MVPPAGQNPFEKGGVSTPGVASYWSARRKLSKVLGGAGTLFQKGPCPPEAFKLIARGGTPPAGGIQIN